MSRPNKSIPLDLKLSGIPVEEALQFEDRLIRILILLETVLRAEKDFKKFIESVFGQTWEFRILKALLTRGSMNKSQLSFEFFGTKRKYYTFVRKGDAYYALNRLVRNGIILKKGNHYSVAPNYKVILSMLFC